MQATAKQFPRRPQELPGTVWTHKHTHTLTPQSSDPTMLHSQPTNMMNNPRGVVKITYEALMDFPPPPIHGGIIGEIQFPSVVLFTAINVSNSDIHLFLYSDYTFHWPGSMAITISCRYKLPKWLETWGF